MDSETYNSRIITLMDAFVKLNQCQGDTVIDKAMELQTLIIEKITEIIKAH